MNNLSLYKWILTGLTLSCILPGLMVFPAKAEILKDPTMPLIDLNRDPMAARDEPDQPKAASLTLQSVIVKGGRKLAVINNQLVKVGQVIEGYEVTRIAPYSADLLGEADTLSLTLMNVKIKN